MSNTKSFLLTLLVVAIFVLGFVSGVISAERKYRDAAIDRGFAEYDAKTGEWQWIGGKDD